MNCITPGELVSWSPNTVRVLYLRDITTHSEPYSVLIERNVMMLVVARTWDDDSDGGDWDLLCLTPDNKLGWLFERLAEKLI